MGRRVIILIVVLVGIAVVGYGAIILTGTCVVTIKNVGEQTIDLVISTAGQTIGSARLEPGGRMIRVFVPNADGEIDIACGADGKVASKGRFDYVTGGMSESYAVTVHSCHNISERSRDILLFR